MITDLLTWLANIAISLIDTLGYAGIVLGMAIESINIPLPSEVLMPFAGALVAAGRFDFWLVVAAGAVGNLIGSVGNYYLGAKGGRPLIERYGKYFLIHHKDLETADRWFARYGLPTVFFTRMLPVVRTFISFPAGVARVPLGKFILYTFAGSFLWSALLTFVGFKLGENWEQIRDYFHQFDLVIGLLLLAGIIWYVKRHLTLRRRHG